jgi:hypothetical protein
MRIAKLNSIKFDQVYGEKISITATLNNGSIIPTRVRIAHVLVDFFFDIHIITRRKENDQDGNGDFVDKNPFVSMYKITQR